VRGDRRLVAVAVGIAALALGRAALASSTQANSTPVFSAGVEVVRLDVIVLDRAGRPVTGLVAPDFEVEEDGRKQAITSFEAIQVKPAERLENRLPPRVSVSRERAPEDGRCLFLLFDDVHVTPVSAERVRASLRRFLDTEVHEGDWVTLMAPDKQVWWTARGGWEYRQLRAVVDHLAGGLVRDPFQSGISDFQAVCMEEYDDPAHCGVASGGNAAPAAVRRDTFQPHGDTGSLIGGGGQRTGGAPLGFLEAASVAKRRISITLDGLRQALESLRPLRGHKSVVLISEGFVLLPKMTGYHDLIDAARRANVAVHLLDPRGLESGFSAQYQDAPTAFYGTDRELNLAGAGDLAEATGGHAILANDPVSVLRELAAESEAYYLLGYTPQAGRPGERKIAVRVRRQDLVVRSRSRYYVEREADIAKAAAKKRMRDEETGFAPAAVAAMRSAADSTGLPLRAATLFFDANARGEVTTLAAAEVGPPPGWRHLKLVAEARRADGGPPVHQTFDETLDVRDGSPVVVAREWRLPPGVWQMRVLAEDAASGDVGTAIHTFEVPRVAALRVSTPILTDEIEQEKGGARPRLTLRRTFAPHGRLYCQFSVYEAPGAGGAAHPVTAAWELRRGRQLVHDAAPTPMKLSPGGRLARLFGLSLDGAAEGAYSLTLRVRDEASGETAVWTEEFEVS
jgi:VWFA-related protein